jgi:hypothetical protein
MSTNFWFEHIIDAYLDACARGEDWKQVCAAAQVNPKTPRRVLNQKTLKEKGISYSRQHLARKIAAGAFPAPFQLPVAGTS